MGEVVDEKEPEGERVDVVAVAGIVGFETGDEAAGAAGDPFLLRILPPGGVLCPL